MNATKATLKRYWFAPDPTQNATSQIAACFGITAWTNEDAKAILHGDRGLSPDEYIIEEEIEISNLDAKHVLPNIGDVTVRGIWFPMS